MVERHQEELVGGIEQIEQKAVDRRAGVLDPLAEHAVADVEEHTEADRHALARELRDRLAHAVFEELEGLPLEAGDEVPVLVGDRRRDEMFRTANARLQRWTTRPSLVVLASVMKLPRGSRRVCRDRRVDD